MTEERVVLASVVHDTATESVVAPANAMCTCCGCSAGTTLCGRHVAAHAAKATA